MENEQPHPDIEKLLEDLKDGHYDERKSAIRKLSQNATYGTIRRLISILAEPDSGILSPKYNLIELLSYIGQKAVPDLLEATHSSNETLVLWAVQALYHINTRDSVLPFIEFVEKAPLSGEARGKVIYYLGRMGDLRAVPALTAAFNRSVSAVEAGEWSKIDPFIWSIVRSLIALSGEGLQPIYQALRSSHYIVRRWVWDCSGQWGKRSAELISLFIPLLKSSHWRERFNIVLQIGWTQETAQEIENALFPLLSDSSTSVRYVTVDRIDSRIERVKLKLLEMSGSDPQPMVRTIVVQGLGDTKDLRVWPAIINAIREDDELVRAAAIRASAKICGTGIIPAEEMTRLITLLLDTLTDTRLHVRQAIFLALGYFTSDQRVISVCREELLVKRSKGEDQAKFDWELHSLIIGLGNSGKVESFEVLVAALKFSNIAVRTSIAENLGQIPSVIKYSFVIEALIERVEDLEEDSWVQQKSVLSLGKSRSSLAFQPLLKCLKIKHLQQIGAEALGQLGDTRAVLPLVDYLLDSSENIGLSEVCTALGQLKDNRAVPALVSELQNSSKYDREKAAIALGKIINPQEIAIDALIYALEDGNVAVRLAAAISLGEIGNPKARPALENARDTGVGFDWDPGVNNSLVKAAKQALSKLKE